MKILVTGATRLHRAASDRSSSPAAIGSYAVTRRTAAPSENSNVEWIEHDLARAVARPASRPQSTPWSTWPSRPPTASSRDGAQDIFAVNVQSTFACSSTRARRRHRSFVLASTGGVYDYSATPIDESERSPAPTHLLPLQVRGRDPLQSYTELFARSCSASSSSTDRARRACSSRRCRQDRAGEEIVIEGDPGLRINPIHVDDAIRVFEPALDARAPRCSTLPATRRSRSEHSSTCSPSSARPRRGSCTSTPRGTGPRGIQRADEGRAGRDAQHDAARGPPRRGGRAPVGGSGSAQFKGHLVERLIDAMREASMNGAASGESRHA